MQNDDPSLLYARNWSERVLGLGESLDAAKLLRHVARQDYVVHEDQIDAMQVLANPTGISLRAQTLARADRGGREASLELRVAEFQQHFFSLYGDERQRRSESLLNECRPFPHLTARLLRLNPGLSVVTPEMPADPGCRSLLQTCIKVFVMPPREAAELRLSFCQDWRNHPEFWEDIVDDMTEQNPEFFDMVAPWVDEFGERRFAEALRDREAYLAQFANSSTAEGTVPTNQDFDIQRQLRELQRTRIPTPDTPVRR